MSTLRKISVALLAGAIMSMSVGCGAKQNTTSESKSPAGSASDSTSVAAPKDNGQKEITIRFSWWGDTKRHEVYNAVADEFEQANPGIKVIREANSWNDYWDKLATQTAGGSAPDVMGMHPQYASDYAQRGALADLQPFIDDGTIETKDIPQSVLEGGKVGDLICMVSQGVTFTNMIANDTLLKEVGVTYPTKDWTWSEYANIAKKFADQAKAAGLNVYFSDDISGQYNTFRYMVRQQGSDLYTEGGDLGFQADVVEKWFAYWKDLRDYGAIPDAATATEAGTLPLEQKLFTLSKTALSVFPVNQLHLYQIQMPDINLVCLRNPTGENGERGELIEGAHNAISARADADHQLAAAKFINFFTNREEALQHLKMEQGVPANTKMAEFIKPLLNEAQQKAINFVNDTTPVARTGVYAPKGATEVDTAFKGAAERVQFNQQSPAQAAEQFMKEAEAILGRNK